MTAAAPRQSQPVHDALRQAKAALIKIRACSIAGCEFGYGKPEIWGDALFASHGDVATALMVIDAVLSATPEEASTAAGDAVALPEGTKHARCYIDRSPTGLWYFYSDEWRGMLLAHRDLATLLADVPAAGRGLFEAMRDWHVKTPYTSDDQLRQMKIYEDFFGDAAPPAAQTDKFADSSGSNPGAIGASKGTDELAGFATVTSVPTNSAAQTDGVREA